MGVPDPSSQPLLERLVDAVACAIYQEGCFAYYGGDVGMTYWRDLTDEQKADDRARAMEIIEEAIGIGETT